MKLTEQCYVCTRARQLVRELLDLTEDQVDTRKEQFVIRASVSHVLNNNPENAHHLAVWCTLCGDLGEVLTPEGQEIMKTIGRFLPKGGAA
jgi:hypothetical protein